MTIVKGKTRLCQSNLSDFNVEMINNSPFYSRYAEFLRVFKKHIHGFDPEIVFAQPEENTSKGTIDWYIPQPSEAPETLYSLKSHDPESYERYKIISDDVLSVLRKAVNETVNTQEKSYLDCAVKFLDSEYSEQLTYCYDGKITFAVWGMRMRKGRDITTVIKEDVKEHRVHTVTYTVNGHGRIVGQSSMLRKHGHVLQGAKDIPQIEPEQHYGFVKWLPEAPHGKVVNNDITYTAVCVRKDEYRVRFTASDGGTLQGNVDVAIQPGNALLSTDIPVPMPNPGFHFDRWTPDITEGQAVNNDLSYTAMFVADEEKPAPEPPHEDIPTMHNVRFVAGDNGKIEGNGTFQMDYGTCIPNDSVPKVKPNKGYTFKGWDRSVNEPITSDTTYTALYEKKLPWWKRFWLWLTASSCLTWLLRFLILLLALFLLYLLLRSCNGCDSHRVINGVGVIDSVKTEDGKVVEDNGVVKPITGNDGKLPEGGGVVAPVMGEGGEQPPIIEQPGTPDIIGNRLFLFMENENDDIDALAADFKKAYPGEQYNIIGFDREVKMLVVQVPEGERDAIRQTINKKIPNHKFLVFDEQIYELNGHISNNPVNPGWHLKAIHLQQGWKYTKGSNKVKVAVIDDGIQASHPMFKGRIVDAYNVFTQNNRLSVGEGHGTHTAGLAVGSAEYFGKGASGVAPNCLLMPIQVFDNKRCPLSALVAGVMYAIHHDADVVNISIGPSFKGLNALPVPVQKQISQEQFKNEMALWSRVSSIAARKKCILVFAAGNDDILSSIPPENRNASSITVTAVDEDMCPTDFTNYGPCSDISAPGKNIFSSFPTSRLQSCDGTSMAAPIVAGTIALMKSIKKDLTVEQARNVLYRTGSDVYGNIPPMVLVDKALEATKRGDFSKPPVRKLIPVPDGKGDDSAAGIAERTPTEPVQPVPNDGNNNDYAEIRRLIKEYENKIKELKKQLPENQ